MSLRPVAAQWFELVTVHKDLARIMECLSRTGAVELEARSRVADRLLFPGLDDELKAHRELARRYRHYWPPAAATAQRGTAPLLDTLQSARARLADWIAQADPVIHEIEALSQQATELSRLRAALDSAGGDFPDLALLGGAGPKLEARLVMLPAGVRPREWPQGLLYKPWQSAEANYALAVGRPADIAEIEAQLPALNGHLLTLPAGLPATPQAACAALGERLATLSARQAAQNAELAALSERLELAPALGDIALIEWLSEHGRDLRGSERLAWVTGWTSDVAGAALRRALDGSALRYVLRVTEPPAGLDTPMVLRNPQWARAFEVFARMLGTPGRYESDPSQLLAVVASLIFGFMFGDVGQGAVVCLAGVVLGRRVPMVRMLIPGGLMAMLFGALFGSVFCREDIIPALWLHPMKEPITLLLAAVALGAAIIALGLLLDAVQMHWRGAARHWWAGRAGLIAAYAGLLAAPRWPQALLVTAFGAGWFVLGETLLARSERLTALAAAAAEFVEQSMRLVVNTLSFARVGAFALAHAGLSFAIIELAQASGRLGYWIVLAIGNVLIVVLEGVVVSIQTTRLLLFEFFIRFLTGAGREFKPLPPPAIASTLQQPNLGGTA